jgi:hypothetical protein
VTETTVTETTVTETPAAPAAEPTVEVAAVEAVSAPVEGETPA